MARPRRGDRERAVVQAAFAAMAPGLSIRSRGRILARAVVAEVIALQEREDPIETALADLRASASGDPALILARDAEAGLSAELVRARVARFEARGARQIDAEQWRAETADIAAELELRWSERFRRQAR
jgi:hypothetical protein